MHLDEVDQIDRELLEVRPWKKPLAIIGAVFILLIFTLSLIPLYAVRINPPPDTNAIADFKLTEFEKEVLGTINYSAVERIDAAINQIDIFDYRILTNRLVSEACSTHSDSCYAKAAYYFIRNLQYVSDPIARQYVQVPAETILSGAGDCEDKALALAVMLEAIGMDADIGYTSNHAFVRIKLADLPFWQKDDDYIWLDPITNQDFGDISFLNKDVVGWYEVSD